MHELSPRRRNHTYRHWVTGLLLIGIGSIFLLDRFALVNVDSVLQFWPFILSAFGVARMAEARSNRQVARGGFMVFLGFWLYASIENLWGLDFENSWPLVLIALGLRHIFAGLADGAKGTPQEKL